jgi:hypothetical protein
MLHPTVDPNIIVLYRYTVIHILFSSNNSTTNALTFLFLAHKRTQEVDIKVRPVLGLAFFFFVFLILQPFFSLKKVIQLQLQSAK